MAITQLYKKNLFELEYWAQGDDTPVEVLFTWQPNIETSHS